MKIVYKKKELFFNERFDELTAFIKALHDKERSAASDQKAKNKLARQKAIRDEKLSKKRNIERHDSN